MAALAYELARLVDRGLGDAEGLARDADAPGVERPHRDGEALSLAAQAVGLGHDHVFEHQLAGRRAVEAHLVEDLPDPNAVSVCGDEERGHACRLLIRAGAREHDVEAGAPEVGDEDLGPVEQVVAPLAPRRHLQRRGV